MLHLHKHIRNSGASTYGVGLRSIVPMHHIAQSSGQIYIRNSFSSMSRINLSHDATPALSRKSGIDQTWHASRGIIIKGLQREEMPFDRSGLDSTQQHCHPSVAPIYMHDPAESAFAGSEDHIEIIENQSPPQQNGSLDVGGVPNNQGDARFVELGAKSPLGYHVPEAKMRELMSSSSTYWQYNMYQGPRGEKVEVHYCKSKETTENVARLFLDEKVVGFDIEWKPQASATRGIRENVALIQLASEERIALFHLARFSNGNNVENFLTPSLQKVLESPNITKVGVSVKGDCTRLRRFLGIDSRGLFELSHLYKLVKFSSGDAKKINKILVSLAQQVQEHLYLPLWKGDVRGSDWTRELNYEQIRYAASDSYAGFQLYHVLESKRKALSPTPPRPAHAELNLAIRLANDQTVAIDDESTEISDVDSNPAASDAVLSIEEIARDFINIAMEDFPAPALVLKTRKSKQDRTPTGTLGPELTAANDWVSHWRGTLSPSYKPRALTCQLRAYALWHEQQHQIPAAAAFLRDPPLQKATVAAYVIEALRSEKLPFEATRLVEVVKCLPESGQARYENFLKRCGVTKQ